MNKQTFKNTCSILLFAAIFSFPAMAQYNWIIPFCIDDIRVPTPPLKVPRIPVGCEVVDCCPGCPGPVIDWRIRVSGEIKTQIKFRIENISAEKAKTLSIKGSGKSIDGNSFIVGNGETIIKGFARDSKNRPPVLVPEMQLDEASAADMIKKSANTKQDSNSDKDVGSTEITIEQMLGDFPVNLYRIRYIYRRCHFPPPPPLDDRIVLANNIANDNAVILLDGRRASGCVNDEVDRGNNIIHLGNVLSNGTCNSEVAVLSDDNAMELISPVNVWTDALGNTLNVTMHPILVVPVTVWLRMGDAATRARAEADIANANLLYNSNNAGISFTAIFNDVSANAAAGAVITNDFQCHDAERTALVGSAFFTANRLNVYYVDRAFTGLNCTAVRNIVFIGTTANNQSLAHEFGHSFSLAHTNGLAGFTAQNLMMGGGAGRTNITDGQCFRCNTNATSTLNTNGVRTGATRTCADGTTSATCPVLSLDNTPK